MSTVITGGTEGVDYTISTIGNIETITFLTANLDYYVQFPKTSTLEYTLVGGGGGGNHSDAARLPFRNNSSGGGGGGGQVLNGVFSVASAIDYLVFVGGGGLGGTNAVASNGGLSIFDSINALGGYAGQTGGGVTDGGTGGNSGSGAKGGRGGDLTIGPTFGGQGNSPGGGGGGSAENVRGGAGANGVTVNGIYYGGGGGGGSSGSGLGGLGGSGGGGFGCGGATGDVGAGAPNTGGGGGGTPALINAGDGGSGIVILAYTIPEPFPCFKQDSKILTDSGYKMIQHLRKGDMVKTKNNGFVPIFAIGKSDIIHPACSQRVSYQLYKCTKNEYPEVFEDLVITGCHSILVDNFKEGEKDKTFELLKDIFVTDNKYRLPACIDERTSVYEVPGDYTIYHFALENDNYYMNYGVYANGLLVETCSKRYLTELSNMELIE